MIYEFKERFEEFIISMNYSRRTQLEYMNYFNKFNYPKLNQDSVNDFIFNPSNNNNVARAFLKLLIKFFKLKHKNLITIEEYNDILEVEIPTVRSKPRKIPEPLSQDQYNVLVKYISKEKDKLACDFAYYCGLRLHEIYNIQIENFNWQKWKKEIEETEKKPEEIYGELMLLVAKGSKQNIVLIPGWLMIDTSRFIKSNNCKAFEPHHYLFLDYSNRSSDINWHYNAIKNAMRQIQMVIRKAGIDSEITIKENSREIRENTRVYMHRLRHSFASNLANQGVDIAIIKELMRHESISSTMIYTHFNKEKLKQVLGSNSMVKEQALDVLKDSSYKSPVNQNKTSEHLNPQEHHKNTEE